MHQQSSFFWQSFPDLISAELTSQIQDHASQADAVIQISNLPIGVRPLWIALLFEKLNQHNLVLIFRDNPEAERFMQELSSVMDSGNLAYFPGLDILPYSGTAVDPEVSRERVNTLFQIFQGNRKIFLFTVESMSRQIVSPVFLREKGVLIQKNGKLERSELIASLVRLGYHREEMVDSYGQFALRGDIIDIFPSSMDSPVRITLFDTEVEKISIFDPVSQRSLEDLSNLQILPKTEILLGEGELQALEEFLTYYAGANGLDQEQLKESFRKKHAFALDSGYEDLLPILSETIPVTDLFPKSTFFILLGREEIISRQEQLFQEFSQLYQEHRLLFPCLEPEKLLIPSTMLEQKVRPRLELQLIGRSFPRETELMTSIKTAPRYNSKLQLLKDDIQEKQKSGYQVWISSPFAAQLHRLQDILAPFHPSFPFSENKDQPSSQQKKSKAAFPANGGLFLIQSDLHEGFICEKSRQLLITDFDIFGRRYRKKTKHKSRRSDPIKSYLDIKPGDYIVHINHGIGQFQGLKRIQAAGKERDFLVLQYHGDDTLYVPLDQISLVQRYIGSGDGNPRLDSLGGTSWQKTKERVRANVEEMARELIQIYAARANLKGFAYSSDTIWQEEFESLFPYEETPDQIQAILDVKDDMESDRPMDRLICGDVGFGKTEVAIRAAFKAVMSGKQVAILVPTTVLCSQHYHTLINRFQEYPIRVGMVSRFSTLQEIQTAKKGVQSGELDILIGTHALLNPEFKFKNLGLVVIDEEQRFGVRHKEKLKKFRTLVDVLTMSATPIPRTLHMSLAKMRDISVINTPPMGRQAVEAYIMEDNPEILKVALEKELSREGQVFYIHNRVETIDAAADFIQTLVPSAIVGVAHGQLPKHELEDIMLDFIEGRINVLVSTTIVESGIDIPNVNTLIVNRADTFGLSQLYQLKGRVGRSGRKAYAYFFYPADRPLSEVAQKRLQVIHEYADLGSGFMVAMRDLEIRGAGNILGPQQSGDILEVGFELYMRLLDDAVRDLSGQQIESVEKPILNLRTDLFIPDEYISDTRQKMEIYKRLEAALHIQELDAIASECQDRFGAPPTMMEILFLNEQIRVYSTQMRIESIQEQKEGFTIKPGKNVKIEPFAIIRLLEKQKGSKLLGKNNELLFIPFSQKDTDKQKRISLLKNVLQDLYHFTASSNQKNEGTKNFPTF